MDCGVIKDLIPLYVDGCCCEESERIVKDHIAGCEECKKVLEDMKVPSDAVSVSSAPKTFRKINDWKASVLQSVLLLISFGLITIGVALESQTSAEGFMNGYWAFNVVIPATGFMLSLTNWYFVRLYRTRKKFSDYSLIITLIITLCAVIWAAGHYELDFSGMLADGNYNSLFEMIPGILFLFKTGILLTAASLASSKILSNQYAKMLGKE